MDYKFDLNVYYADKIVGNNLKAHVNVNSSPQTLWCLLKKAKSRRGISWLSRPKVDCRNNCGCSRRGTPAAKSTGIAGEVDGGNVADY